MDGRIVLIPNGDVFVKPITNFSQAEFRRIEIISEVTYKGDTETVRLTALQAISAIPGLRDDPHPEVWLQNFGTSTLDLIIHYWIDTNRTTLTAAKDTGVKAIKKAFEGAEIGIPSTVQTDYQKP